MKANKKKTDRQILDEQVRKGEFFHRKDRRNGPLLHDIAIRTARLGLERSELTEILESVGLDHETFDDVQAGLGKPYVLPGKARLMAMPREYSWNPYIPRGAITIVAGRVAIGKGWLGTHAHRAMTFGADWFDGQSCRASGQMLWCDSERHQAEVIERCNNMGIDPPIFLVDNDREFEEIRLDQKKHIQMVKYILNDLRINSLFIDSLSTALGMKIEERSSKLGRVLKQWQPIAREYNILIIVSHHVRKGKWACAEIEGHNVVTLADVRGSSSICAVARSVIAIDAPEFGTKVRRLHVVKSSGLRETPPALGFLPDEKQGVKLCRTPQDKDTKGTVSKVEEAEEFLLEVLAEGEQDAEDIAAQAEQQGITRGTLDRAKQNLRLTQTRAPTKDKPQRSLWGLNSWQTDNHHSNE